ncbi:MAG: heme-copper oxidase subunit III [Alphaproteobacteria bacterium]|nr:heme-copper oxidase subunit III [Rhodospirillales bacterium]MCW9044892.1 heme-copper oxidase subunit III [Alphaproteobacteria bacterium]
MTTDSSSGVHEHHWETSWSPFAVVIGIFFLVVLTFSAHYVYENTLLTIVCAGIGTPFLLAGIAKWVHEGLTEKPLISGVAGVGLPIFIISEVFIFLALFVTYWVMRLSAPEWPPEGTPHINTALPIIMTIILVSSSWTAHVAEEKAEANDLAGFRTWIWYTIILGTLFFGCTAYEYNHLLSEGFGPSTNAFSTIFYTITGFHASHVLIGLGAFFAVLIPAYKGMTNHTLTTCVSVYWHFVDVVWFFVLSQIYFW